MCRHFELLRRIREKEDEQLWMKKLSGSCDVSFPHNMWKWRDHRVAETGVSVLAGPEGQTGRSCAFSSFCCLLQPHTDNWQDLRQRKIMTWDWHCYRRPEYTLYGCSLSSGFVHANCNHIPAGSQASESAAVLFQRWQACSGCLIARCLNIFFAFSTMCGGRTLTYCAA